MDLTRETHIHRAIAFIIEAEQELAHVDRDAELCAARMRHSLYKLMGFDNGRDYSEREIGDVSNES